MTTAITYVGTGTNIVEGIFYSLGIDLVKISKPGQVWNIRADYAILLGGADINPAIYGQKRGPWTAKPQNSRDTVELEILRYADFHNIPLMGICRGHQLMTAYYGGTLHQDIFDVKGHFHSYYHNISPRGKLLDCIPTQYVNSLHHQAVNDVPSGFKVLARAYDGIVESIWRPGRLGVQFHPELMFTTNRKWFNLFRWFVSGFN